MLYYQQTVESTLESLHTSTKGLSATDASVRLKHHGANTVIVKGEPLWRKLIEPFTNVFMAVLFLAVFISIWHAAYFDAIIIVCIMLASAVIYYVQRFSTERILRALQRKDAQKVTVTRAGLGITIDAIQLVPGDIIRLSEGDKIPADIRIIDADSVRVDESILTGESVAVSKSSLPLKGKKEVYEQSNMLFSGSFIVSGNVHGVVAFTGNNTEFGHIAALANTSAQHSEGPVQKKIDKLISIIVAVVFGMAVVVFALALWRGMELSEALRFVIALSVSAVPESLPVAISVILVLGMRRMAAKKALVRSMEAIETIGVVTTIATDKTGTLTKNLLSVQETWEPSWKHEPLTHVLKRSINHHANQPHDPLDIALITFTSAESALQLRGEPVSRLPFDQDYAMSGNIWKTTRGHELAVKGAPEHILDRCLLQAGQRKQIEAALTQLTTQGYRVIAVATTPLAVPFATFKHMHARTTLQFTGLVAIADTLRPAAKHAIAVAHQAGVSVRMITGDHFETAYAIGVKLGLVESRDQVFDSRRMSALSDAQLAKQVQAVRVFSRVTPENKYRILQALKKNDVTAMTGDGVNDVPALAGAHVGIAMGSGAQIAKDTGEIILLNNDFTNIVRAIHEGRIIFANIRRMLFYLLSTNIGEVLTTIGAMLVGMPVPLVPVQILWVNLVTDTTMVIPLGLEPGEKNAMKRKPVPPTAPILSPYMLQRLVIVALVMAVLSLSLYAFYSARYGAEYGRTITFIALVVVQWANAFNARSTFESAFRRLFVWNGAFWVGFGISLGLQALAIFGPLQELLHMHPVALSDILIVSIIAFFTAILAVELHKLFGRLFVRSTTQY